MSPDVERVLAALRDPFVTCPVEDAWLVAGPPGVYVVIDSSTPEGDLRNADAFAARVRLALADHLTLAPYVHPLLVSDAPAARPGASVVSLATLHAVLTSGLPIVDPTTLDRIREIAGRGSLDAGTDGRHRVRGWAGAPSLH